MAEKVEIDSPLSSLSPLTPEATVKTEDLPRDGASSANRPSSPEPNCAICLSGPKNKSFTDSCFHQFCFTCLLEWSKVKAECPLCKQVFRCIIHNIRSLDDYDKYLVQSNPPTLSPSSLLFEGLNQFVTDQTERFRGYRTTMGSDMRHVPENFHYLFEAFVNNERYRQQYDGSFVLPTTRRQPSRRNALSGTSDFRRNIYRHNLWVRPQPDVSGRFRESSPEFYRLNEAATHRLVPWLNRELNVLVPDAEQQDTVMSLILRNITIHPIRSVEFQRLLTPHIGPHVGHFIHEFYSYAISQFDLIGYDTQVQYVSYNELGRDPDVGSYEVSSDTDSDIQIVEDHPRPRIEDSNVSSSSSQNAATIDDGNDSDCIVLEEVNPANRRIELIDVLSDDDSTAETVIVHPGSTTVNVSSLSSDDDFYCIDEFPQVKNTTISIPKLKLRDLREIIENPYLPSTSNSHVENPRSILRHASRMRKSRVSSRESLSFLDSTDSDEEWRPVGSKVKKKKKKKRSKSCCCEKLKKHWKKECLADYKCDSDSEFDYDSDLDYETVAFNKRTSRQKFTSENRSKSSYGSKKKFKSEKPAPRPRLLKDCDFVPSSPSSVCSNLSDASDLPSCFSVTEDEIPLSQLRNKSKKPATNVKDQTAKKCLRSSKRKQSSASHSSDKKTKSRKHFKSHYSPVSPESNSDTCEWPSTSRLRSDSSESEDKPSPKRSRLRKKCQPLRILSDVDSPDLTEESEEKPTPKKCKSSRKKCQVSRTYSLSDADSSDASIINYYVPKPELRPTIAVSPDSDLESNNSSSGRPRLKSVVRVVNSQRNADSLPHYEIVSSSLDELCPGPSTSKSSENSSGPSLRTNLKRKVLFNDNSSTSFQAAKNQEASKN